MKCYSIYNFLFLHLQHPAKVGGTVSSGCFPLWRPAEIKPVEPDQGNACAGKVNRISVLSSFAKQHFPQINFCNLLG
jgi:hypothetical protein